MALGLFGLGEETGGLNDELDAHRGPGELGGGAGGDDLDLVAVDHEHIVLGLVGAGLLGGDGALELALGGVILDQIGQIVGGNDVADGHDVERGAEEALLDEGAENEAADAAETIDSNFDSHDRGLRVWCLFTGGEVRLADAERTKKGSGPTESKGFGGAALVRKCAAFDTRSHEGRPEGVSPGVFPSIFALVIRRFLLCLVPP